MVGSTVADSCKVVPVHSGKSHATAMVGALGVAFNMATTEPMSEGIEKGKAKQWIPSGAVGVCPLRQATEGHRALVRGDRSIELGPVCEVKRIASKPPTTRPGKSSIAPIS